MPNLFFRNFNCPSAKLGEKLPIPALIYPNDFSEGESSLKNTDSLFCLGFPSDRLVSILSIHESPCNKINSFPSLTFSNTRDWGSYCCLTRPLLGDDGNNLPNQSLTALLQPATLF